MKSYRFRFRYVSIMCKAKPNWMCFAGEITTPFLYTWYLKSVCCFTFRFIFLNRMCNMCAMNALSIIQISWAQHQYISSLFFVTQIFHTSAKWRSLLWWWWQIKIAHATTSTSYKLQYKIHKNIESCQKTRHISFRLLLSICSYFLRWFLSFGSFKQK